jgi:class 3 adenylate cyclase
VEYRHLKSFIAVAEGLSFTRAAIRLRVAQPHLSRENPPFNPILLRARISAGLERKRWRERERRYLERIELEREKYEALLRNILPGQIVTRLNDGEVVIADRVEEVTILFADLVGFTEIASRLSPAALVDHLNPIFSAFDGLCRKMGIEKIKTIGDAYMAAAGLPQPRPGQTAGMAEFALAMLATLEQINQTLEIPFQIRIGIHTGPVIAGVIGVNKRLGRHGEPREPPRGARPARPDSHLGGDPPGARGRVRLRAARPDRHQGHGQDRDRVPRQPQARPRARRRPGRQRRTGRDAERRLRTPGPAGRRSRTTPADEPRFAEFRKNRPAHRCCGSSLRRRM